MAQLVSGCHSENAQPSAALAAQGEKISTHPCYSKGAHQYARMHLPVAPACNIQCNYCNRKFDCSNESRPGVVSKLLSPSQAVKRFEKVKARIPETRVVGIAGPGDPLANPAATLASLRAIAAKNDNVHLCVSTNGLALLELVDELKAVGVDHLTITINCIDAVIGEKIYPWIYFNHKRLRGREAAQTLIDRQLAGLEAAVAAGMLVKVNTVLIPGINEHHVAELAAELKRYGALLHNVMPLISDPAHGTYFGLTGQRGPTEQELEQARLNAGQNMDVMSHCQQCRADAVGRLGQDVDMTAIEQQAEANLCTDTWLVAVASQSGVLVDQHFGHATSCALYKISPDQIEPLPHREVARYCSGSESCDEDSTEQKMAQLIQTLQGCDRVLCSRIGIGPWQALQEEGIEPSTDFALLTIDDALCELQRQLQAQQLPFAQKEVC